MIVAGEASGDKHGGSLARTLHELNPGIPIQIFGSGGDEMRAAGVDTLVDARDMAIMGIPEVASAFGRFYEAYRTLVSEAVTRKPDAAILIDWPDFNLRLARRLHHYGIKVIYYISPQVWAWRQYRIGAIKRYVDRMLVILPFEREFYRRFGIDAEYVGHPLAETVRVTATREEFAARHGLDPARLIISLLPGSRGKEIHYHVPPMLEAAGILSKSSFEWVDSVRSTTADRHPLRVGNSGETAAIADAQRPQFVIPLASTIGREQVQPLIADHQCNVRVIERDTYNAVGHSAFAVVASGTATIETAILGTPMVIVYKGSELNWRLIRPLIHLDTFGMANLIAGRKIVPELIQHDLTGPAIAHATLSVVSDPERLCTIREQLAEVRRQLKSEFAGYEQAARAVMRVIQG
ncbi:MAG TPA: lipid-A-disaccharide synthase [Blastocatellia bacterium]